MKNKLKIKGDEERMASWVERLIRKEFISDYELKSDYKGVKYLIKVSSPMSPEKITECYVSVDCPEETKPLKELVDEIDEYSDFLWHATIYISDDKKTLNKQIELCHKWAKEDIDSLPDKIKEAEAKIKKIQGIIQGLKKFRK